MIQFIVKRLLYGVLVLIGVLTVVFLLFNVLPGDPARMMMGQRADEESIKIINKDLGLDQPLTTQFVMYVNDVLPISLHSLNEESRFYLDSTKYDYATIAKIGNKKAVVKVPYLRRSYQSKRKVSEILFDSMPETAVLAFAAMLLSGIIGILMGVVAAVKKSTWMDNSILFSSILGLSGPSFFMGIIIAWLFGYVWTDWTGLNTHGSLYSIDDLTGEEYLDLKNLILPTIALFIRPLAIIVQLTRNSMLEVLSLDFVRTARAKGLSFRKVVIKHALKNALNPVITTISGMFGSLLAGALFIEMVFGWKGIGWVIYVALTKHDMPVVMGGVLTFSLAFVIINILVDISYGMLDPRVRIQ